MTITVTFAAWNFDPSVDSPVPLFVYSFPASYQPPVLTAPPEGTGGVVYFLTPTDGSGPTFSLDLGAGGPGGIMLAVRDAERRELGRAIHRIQCEPRRCEPRADIDHHVRDGDCDRGRVAGVRISTAMARDVPIVIVMRR